MTPKPKPKTPREKMTDLTRRLVAVPKSEILPRKTKKPPRQKPA